MGQAPTDHHQPAQLRQIAHSIRSQFLPAQRNTPRRRERVRNEGSHQSINDQDQVKVLKSLNVLAHLRTLRCVLDCLADAVENR